MITSGEYDVSRDGRAATLVVSFDFGVVGSESLDWTEIRSDLKFTAGTGDPDRGLVYLARPGQLYVVDASVPKPRPELIATLDPRIQLDEMTYDDSGRRILGLDQQAGQLYMIDLEEDQPDVTLVAEDLAGVTEMSVWSTDSSVLLLDSSGRRVLEVDCPRGGPECSRPRVFAAIPEFERPNAVTRTSDGTVLVGDLGAESIFSFDSEGKLLRVLDSMSGFAD